MKDCKTDFSFIRKYTSTRMEQQKVYDAIRDLDEALTHRWEMSYNVNQCKIKLHDAEYSTTDAEHHEIMINGKFEELRKNYHEALAAYEAAEQAVVDATKKANEADEEYYKNLKCTFCGELDSICGGDHSEEMRDLGQKRY
jgi:hypothetical protein